MRRLRSDDDDPRMWVTLSPLRDNPKPRYRRATLNRNGPTLKIPGRRARSHGRQRGARSRSRDRLPPVPYRSVDYKLHRNMERSAIADYFLRLNIYARLNFYSESKYRK